MSRMQRAIKYLGVASCAVPMLAAAGCPHDVAVTLNGDFDISGTVPDAWLWETSDLTLGGETPTVQAFEVAGRDLGCDPAGWVNNFAMGTLTVASGAEIHFVDYRDNDGAGQTLYSEALYLNRLVLDTGAHLVLENCRVYVRCLQRSSGVTVDRNEALVVCGDPNCDGGVTNSAEQAVSSSSPRFSSPGL